MEDRRLSTAGPRERVRGALLLALAALAALAAPSPARAHGGHRAEALLVLKADGTFQVDLRVDLQDLLAEGPDEQALDPQALDGLRALLERRLRVRFDGTPVPYALTFPRAEAGGNHVLGGLVRLEGDRPAGAGTVSFSASRAFGRVTLTVLEEGTRSGKTSLLDPGDRSEPFVLEAGRKAPEP